MNWLTRDYRRLQEWPRNMRILLFTNMIFAFVLPVIEIFVAAYIMRNSQEASKVAAYQLSIYSATPLAFFANGLLLERIGVKRLYAMGMMLSGVSLVWMMHSTLVTRTDTILSGLLMGLATGLFWANRGLLALVTTEDANRNYFYGLELSVYTFTSVVVPAAIGWFIAGASRYGWLSSGANGAYRAVAIGTCLLAGVASWMISRGDYGRPAQPRFVYFRFHKTWLSLLMLASLFGLGQGYLVTAPALLVLMLVGKEGTLGAILSLGGLVSALLLYVIGRVSRPAHRVLVLGIGISLFLVGSLVNTVFFNAKSVFVFMICLVLAKPTLEWSYFPIQLQVIDVVAVAENRNRYTYVFNHELGLYAGRLAGCGLFLFLALNISDVMALRIALPTIAAVQLLSIPLAKKILRMTQSMEAETIEAPATLATVT